MNKAIITKLIMIGDSLSDRGSWQKRTVFGYPLTKFTPQLKQFSPMGRFTNGLAWSDHLGARIAGKFLINGLLENHPVLQHRQSMQNACEKSDDALTHATPKALPQDCTDVADAIINKEKKTRAYTHGAYHLDDDKCIRYKNEVFVRSHNEGGLTAYDYKWKLTRHLQIFLSRMLVSTLKTMRERIHQYDTTQPVSAKEKQQTLILEWSGANDLITVNKNISKKIVDRTIQSRINNIKKLINQGYKHFVLLNLPDLSLTPRYQSQKKEISKLHRWINYFNQHLTAAVSELQNHYPECTISICDINHKFCEIYQHPEHYHFDKEKLHQPYIESQEFQFRENQSSSSSGYMFWDKVHPTGRVHALLAEYLEYTLSKRYHFSLEDEQADLTQKFTQSCKSVTAPPVRAPRRGFFFNEPEKNMEIPASAVNWAKMFH